MSYFKKFIVALFTFALMFSFITPANAWIISTENESASDLVLNKRTEYIGDTDKPGFSVEYTGPDDSYSYLEIKNEDTQEYAGHCYLNYYTKKCSVDLALYDYYTETPYTPSGEHRYKAYLHLENSQTVISNEIRYERKPLSLSLSATSPDFGRYTNSSYTFTLNQETNGSSHSVFVVDLSDNRVLTNGLTFNDSHTFNFGPTHYYQAFFAKVPRNADGTLKVNPTRGELTDIQATSNIISLSRQPWRTELYIWTPDLLIRTFKGGGSYLTYVVENSTQKIIAKNTRYDDSSIYISNNNGHGTDTSWATSYVAQAWETKDGGNGVEPQYLSDLKDIQADSNGFSLKTSATNDPEATKGGANPAQECAQGCHGDPINTATGEFFENIADISMPGSGTTPSVARSYGVSRKSEKSNLGYGWVNNYDMKLYVEGTTSISAAQQLKVKQENGSIIKFQKLADGTYETDTATKATLTYANNQYTLTRNKGEVFVFDANGKLEQIKDLYGSIVLLAYTNDVLTSAADAKGNSISFTYGSTGLLENATDNLGNAITYTYDANERMTKATNSNGIETNYEYDVNNLITMQSNPLGGETRNEYDGYGRVIKQIDPLNREMLFLYEGSGDNTSTTITYPDTSVVKETYYKGQLSSKTLNPSTPNERKWKYFYNEANQIISLVNPDGTSNSNLYDENGNITQAIDTAGRTTEITYNEFNKPLTAKNAAGNITTNTYDSIGNLLTTTNPLGETTSYTYNPDGTVATATDAKGNAVNAIPAEHTSIFSYTSKGLLETTTNALGHTSKNIYDTQGRVVSNISPRGMETGANENDFKNSVVYNSLNLPVSTTDPLLNETALTYDSMGNVLTSEDALGNISSYTYDVMGKMLTKTNALQETVSYHYDSMNRIDSITDAAGKVSTITYDIFGQVVETRDALQRVSKQEWDISGNMIATVDSNNARTEFSYDSLGNLVSTKNPTGDITTFSYDILNQLISAKDAEGKETKNEYDALGRTVKTIYPDSTFTSSTYDAVGNIVSTTNQAGKVRSWEYDDLGRKTKYIDETLREESYAYDAASNLISKTRADNSVVSYVYDTRNLLTTVDYPGTDSDITYLYDALGRKVSEQKGAEVATTYAYDAIGQLTSRGPPNTKVSYEYDAVGNTTKLTYPSGRVVHYAYDDASQLTSLTDATLGTVAYGYDNRGNSTSTTLPNQVIESSTYDANNRLTGVSIANGSNVIYKKTHAYSAIGNIVQQDKTGTGITTPTLEDFSYDPLSRLTSQNKNADGSPVNAYAYDAVGNLTTINGTPQAFDDSGKIVSSGSKTFAYDGRNNRTNTTSGTPAAPEKNYEWAVDNLLSEVEVPADTKTVNYSYDVSGLLGTRSENSTQTNEFVWDTTSSIPLMLSDGEYEYIYGTGRTPLAQVSITDGSIKYLHSDANGSITASTDTTGTLSGSVIYSPYGTTTDAPISNFGFAGEWTDKTTGHSYLRARWLDTATGTFLSEDPLTQSTGQAFGYTAGNPLQQIDPLGLCNVLAGDLGNIGSSCYAFADTQVFQSATDSVAGFGDVASFGGTSAIRELFALNNVVNTCSTAYTAGEWAGTAASFITPGGVAKAGGAFPKAGIVFSKWSKQASGKVKSVLKELKEDETGAIGLPKWGNKNQIKHTPKKDKELWKFNPKDALETKYANIPGNGKTGFHKQPKGRDGKHTWWSVDFEKHGASRFKVYREEAKGLRWIADADEYGDYIVNKHKGQTGRFIEWKRLN